MQSNCNTQLKIKGEIQMANLTIENILTLTLEDAYKWYEEYGLGFSIKDGKISGFYKNV